VLVREVHPLVWLLAQFPDRVARIARFIAELAETLFPNLVSQNIGGLERREILSVPEFQ
jgi:hypothetical protein